MEFSPDLPEDINWVAPTQQVELVAKAWSQIVEKIDSHQKKIEFIHIKEQKNPRAMLENITQVIYKGDII